MNAATVIHRADEANPRYNNGTLIELAGGRLLMIYQQWYLGRHDASPGRLLGRHSDDGGSTWSAGRIIKESYDPDAYAGGGKRIGSPALLAGQDGSLLLFHDVMNTRDDHRTHLCRSYDQGVTWSESVPLSTALGYYVMNNDRAVRLGSGRILAPSALHGPMPATRRHGHAFCFYSDDDGLTWERSTDSVDVGSESGSQEPGVVELTDGRVMMYVRTDHGRPYRCYSADQGLSWSQPAPMSVASPCSPQTIRRIPSSGDLLMMWNDTRGPARRPLTSAISRDEGDTWEQRVTLEDEDGLAWSYPSIAFRAGDVLATYYVHDVAAQRISLKLRILPLATWYGAAA